MGRFDKTFNTAIIEAPNPESYPVTLPCFACRHTLGISKDNRERFIADQTGTSKDGMTWFLLFKLSRVRS